MSGAGADAQKKREWQAVIDEMTKLLSKKATERLIDKQLSEIFFDGRGWYVFFCGWGGGCVFLVGISVVFSNPSLYETQASPELCPCSSISISISTSLCWVAQSVTNRTMVCLSSYFSHKEISAFRASWAAASFSITINT